MIEVVVAEHDLPHVEETQSSDMDQLQMLHFWGR